MLKTIYNIICLSWSEIFFSFEAYLIFGNIQWEKGLIFITQTWPTDSVSEQVEDCWAKELKVSWGSKLCTSLKARVLVDQAASSVSCMRCLPLYPCYWTKLGYSPPMRSKANLLPLGCGEGKCSAYCKAPDKESWKANARKDPTPRWVSAKHF